MITFTKKDGTTKYYASYETAWNRAAKLNETATNGIWFFEADINGWFLFFVKDNETMPNGWGK